MQPGWPAPAPDCRRDRCVALTFDDGPGPHTGRLLDRLRRELLRTGDLVRRLTGVRIRVMRPPYGMTDGRVARETRRQGMAQILWDVDTRDWRDRDPADVTRRAARASPGSVVLRHDLHRATVRAMTGVLDRLSRRGYRFVTVSEPAGGGRRASAAKR
ncbi:MAG: chitin deacetylase [Nonomuraea muscovyensis]|jgi:peptidoglycan/xylan/chitin deacetylase (PgdA/CDA1 family)|nr:chitin deacetylase [Nonomuraea muscovyensis]